MRSGNSSGRKCEPGRTCTSALGSRPAAATTSSHAVSRSHLPASRVAGAAIVVRSIGLVLGRGLDDLEVPTEIVVEELPDRASYVGRAGARQHEAAVGQQPRRRVGGRDGSGDQRERCAEGEAEPGDAGRERPTQADAAPGAERASCRTCRRGRRPPPGRPATRSGCRDGQLEADVDADGPAGEHGAVDAVVVQGQQGVGHVVLDADLLGVDRALGRARAPGSPTRPRGRRRCGRASPARRTATYRGRCRRGPGRRAPPLSQTASTAAVGTHGLARVRRRWQVERGLVAHRTQVAAHGSRCWHTR